MEEVVIVSAARTAMGRFEGTLQRMKAGDIGAVAVKEAVARAGIEPAQVDEVIMGNVLGAGQGQNPARQASIKAGIPVEAGALTVNKVCGSGMKSMMIAACEIMAGKEGIIVAGGMENMNLAPYSLPKARGGMRLNNSTVEDLMVKDGLWDVYNDFHMGNTGELVAEGYELSREDIDAFAYRSHQLASKAQADGLFNDEITPIEIPQRKGDPIVFDHDEGVRADTTLEKMGRLPAVFKKGGVVTAANASQISDGGSAMVLMSRSKADELGIKPMATIKEFCTVGMVPEKVMFTPVPGIKKIFDLTGYTMDDIDYVEHNEAFASASCAVQREFDIPDSKFNVKGGAVALGHPIGCSGNRIMVTLLYTMLQNNAKRGLGTICLGGGNATTMILERE